jgi:hypothetical protein
VIMPSPRGRRCPEGADEGDERLALAGEVPSSGRSGHLLPEGEGEQTRACMQLNGKPR